MKWIVLLVACLFQIVLGDVGPHALELTELSRQSPTRIIDVTNSDLELLFHHPASLSEEKSKYTRGFWTLLTITSTNPKHQCSACQDLKTILPSIAKSYYADHEDSHSLFFVNIDLMEESNTAIFKHLNVTTIPHILLIPPTYLNEQNASDERLRKKRKLQAKTVEDEEEDRVDSSVEDDDDEAEKEAIAREEAEKAAEKAQDELRKKFALAPFSILYERHMKFSFPRTDLAGQELALADFISQAVQKLIHLRQENQIFQFVKYFGLTFAVIVYIKKRGPSIVTNALKKSNVYRFLALLLLLASVCGYSFTRIQQVPFLAQNEHGQVIFISGGTQYQFGVEIVLVGSNYALLAANLLLLVYLGKYKVTKESVIGNELVKCLCIAGSTAMLYVLYSCLTSMVLRKDNGYPYHLAKLF